MKQTLSIAFWNVYNLLREGAHANRGPKSAAERQAKLDALATVIMQLAGGDLPDVLVLAEIGDVQLVAELTSRLRLSLKNPPLQVFEPPPATDETGIVVLALTQSVANLTRIDAENRNDTIRPRALSVRVTLASPNCPPLYLVACHWKSDRPEGNPRQDRRMSGRWLNDHLNGNAPNGKADAVIVVGDFNTEPCAPEMCQSNGLYSARHIHKSIRAKSVRLFNCMWPWLVDPEGWKFLGAKINITPQTLTSQGSDEPRILDQVLISRSILKEERFSLISVEYFHDNSTTMQLPHLKTRVPNRWSWDDVAQTGTGTSDHFPLIATLLY